MEIRKVLVRQQTTAHRIGSDSAKDMHCNVYVSWSLICKMIFLLWIVWVCVCVLKRMTTPRNSDHKKYWHEPSTMSTTGFVRRWNVSNVHINTQQCIAFKSITNWNKRESKKNIVRYIDAIALRLHSNTLKSIWFCLVSDDRLGSDSV